MVLQDTHTHTHERGRILNIIAQFATMLTTSGCMAYNFGFAANILTTTEYYTLNFGAIRLVQCECRFVELEGEMGAIAKEYVDTFQSFARACHNLVGARSPDQAKALVLKSNVRCAWSELKGPYHRIRRMAREMLSLIKHQQEWRAIMAECMDPDVYWSAISPDDVDPDITDRIRAARQPWHYFEDPGHSPDERWDLPTGPMLVPGPRDEVAERRSWGVRAALLSNAWIFSRLIVSDEEAFVQENNPPVAYELLNISGVCGLGFSV
ncbi:hypothetical protein GGTG_00819 [Gaeumannomyces tritici R3-111a-1]|uniref:Uncharacterized protein n=1 Tax=Gaeumannomyces tritici (strain R3-111a-1) TaxID=644352 RepID=J3NHT2_GAET3|nr:hypothetical protein GGTG_00819 [Gaeumannomyces tritici R3-111a-1]EJT80825.1 hypothetical protein GGTG_00819 [Gaeumannomyces tritici R3-111a-1]